MKCKKLESHECPAGFWIVTCVFILVCIWQVRIVSQELPGLVEWYASQGYGYTPEQMEGLADSPQVGFYTQAVLPVEGELADGTEETMVRMADAEYFAWSGMELEAGQWPKDSAEAVVSYDWALSQYKHLDIIGQPLQVDGRKCRISGVYRTRRSWRQRMASDGIETIYLLFSVQNVSADHRMNYIYFEKKGQDFQCNQDYLEDITARACGVRTEPDLVLDVESVSHVCMQNVAVCVLLWLLMAALHFRSVGKKAAGSICLLVCAAAIMCIQWYIPMSYLPKEQIFAVGEYIRQYMQGQNLRHLYQESGYFGNLAYIHIWISWGMVFAAGAIAALGAVSGCCRYFVTVRNRVWH